jgi:hypothetical protein
MKTRCDNTKHSNYPNYGGRGIKVCKKWQTSFKSFVEDMGIERNTLKWRVKNWPLEKAMTTPRTEDKVRNIKPQQ